MNNLRIIRIRPIEGGGTHGPLLRPAIRPPLFQKLPHLRPVTGYTLHSIPSTTPTHLVSPKATNPIPIATRLTEGAEAGYFTALRLALADERGFGTTELLFAGGALSAVCIAATLSGLSLGGVTLAGIGAASIFGVSSALVSKHTKPHFLPWKICEVGKRVLPLALLGNMVYGAVITGRTGLMLNEAFLEYVGNMHNILLGFGLAGMATKAIVDVKRAYQSRMGMVSPISKKTIAKVLVLGNVQISTKLIYLTYRTIVFAGFLGSTFACYVIPSPLLGIGLLVATAITFALPPLLQAMAEKRFPEVESTHATFSQWGAKYVTGKIHKLSPSLHPLLQMQIEYLLEKIPRFAPFAATALLTPDSADWLCSLATIYLGGWTVRADYHGGTASIGLAVNWMRSMFYPGNEIISDGFRSRMDYWMARVSTCVVATERTFAHLINILTMEHPRTEMVSCDEGKPYDNIKQVLDLRRKREVDDYARKKQADIYRRFIGAYCQLVFQDQSRVNVAGEAIILANLLNQFGKDLGADENPAACHYFREIREEVENKGEKIAGKGQAHYKLDAEDAAYVRHGYDALRFRGFELRELANDLITLSNVVTYNDLVHIYLDFLMIYSTRAIHLLRRATTGDDGNPTKTWNVGEYRSRCGDTIYEVWGFDASNHFYYHKVPGSYVQLPNPDYDHTSRTQRYIYARRESVLSLLGISQSSSEQFKLVNNAPLDRATEEQITIQFNDETLTFTGFYSNEEFLPVNNLIDWNNQPVNKQVMQKDSVWIGGNVQPPDFRNKFSLWASSYYVDKDGNSTYSTLAQTFGAEALWYKDAPEVIAYTPVWGINIFDEGYTALSNPGPERMGQAELRYTAEYYLSIRLVNYDQPSADFPNPDPTIPVEQVRRWRIADAYIGFRYAVVDADGKEREWNAPYGCEDRETFITFYNKDWNWQNQKDNIAYGIISEGNPGADPIITVYSKKKDDNDHPIVLGVIHTPYPRHLPPPDQIKGRKIEIDVFPERAGQRSWLEADYGDD